MARVDVNPTLLEWAMERSRKDVSELQKRWPKIREWLTGAVAPTMKQLRDFAVATSSPLGYFFLSEPPEEPLPIPDFRTLTATPVRGPSADLLDTLYTMQQRQAWLSETLIEEEVDPVSFVGSVTLDEDPNSIAQEMRATVGLDDGWARSVSSWRLAVGELRRRIESIGVLAVINGVVGNNTHRKLDVNEFQGFALCDSYAPLIFVNGADWESAKMFTLAHELAHVWLGQEALSGFQLLIPDYNDVEVFCNKVAAEFLVPERELRDHWPRFRREDASFQAAARHFKVGPIVAARRALDLKLITRSTFFKFYEDRRKFHATKRAPTGGDFYRNQSTRVGDRFATEVIRAAKEGRLLYRDAYKLTGLQGATFNKYAEHLGFDML